MRTERRQREPGSASRAALELSPVRIGISACLLGEEVRFDGGHKRDTFLTEILGPHVQWIPVCPEVEVGMGTPREPVRLHRSGKELRMITTRTGHDYTDAMNRWAAASARQLARQDLCGYVLKKDSPSCGMERVKVYDGKGVPDRTGRGLFAQALMTQMPWLPVEEEGRLTDPSLRENFIERVFAFRRLKDFFTGRFTPGGLVRFHTTQKMTLLAHSPSAYRDLGRLVAAAAERPRRELRDEYQTMFMTALASIATPGRHANVLMHIAGYFKRSLDGDSRAELMDCIDAYRRGLAPLVVPLTLIKHHVRTLQVDYLASQSYLDPHPRELILRNHA